MPDIIRRTLNDKFVAHRSMNRDMTFGQKIRELRKTKGLTQRDLAERVAHTLKKEDRRGFDFTYLSKIENDRLPPPSTAAILQLAKELDADSDELLALAGKAPPDIGETLKRSQAARTFYRSAMRLRLSENDWIEISKLLNFLKN